MLNVAQLRADTPGCRTKAHFNNAGAALMPTPVLQAMQDYLTLESEIGGYEAADLRIAELNQSYAAAARLLNADARNIAWTASATNAFVRAVSSLEFITGDVIVTTNEDYSTNQIAFLSLQKQFGIQLLRAASLPEGGVDVDDMERLIRTHRPRLVSVTHVPTNTGLVQPVETIGQICRELDVTYLVDACQSIGQLPLDVEAIGCDFLCVTMRKFLRGPRGMGFLYVADRILNKPWKPLFIDSYSARWTAQDAYTPREDAQRFQDAEQSYALVAGCTAALNYADTVGVENIAQRNEILCNLVRAGLQQLPGARLLDKGAKLSSIITVQLPFDDPNVLLQTLRAKNINIHISNHSGALIDLASKGVEWALRISPHYYNTEDEIGLLLEALEEL